MESLILYFAQELGVPAGRLVLRWLIPTPEVRALNRVIRAALTDDELAALAAPADRDGFLAALRDRLGDHPPGRRRSGRTEVSEATLRQLTRDWVAPLVHSPESPDDSFLAALGIDPEHLADVLYALIRAGIRADAVAGGPLKPLDDVLRHEHTSDRLAAIAPQESIPPTVVVTAGVAPVDSFTGRDAEMAELVARLTEPPPDAVPVLAIHGPPGIGKSALAGELGRHSDVVERYPDGVLLVDLLGWTDGMKPPKRAPVLAQLLGQAGVPASGDGGVGGLLATWRGWLAGRRVLVVLDNARGEKQVRHLLPDQPGCALVVTSRERLGHLAGATVFPLGALADADAAELLRTLAGPERLDDVEATARILALCGGWPLAIRLAGGIFRNDADATAAEVAQALTDARAVELDPMTARLRVSYNRLDDELRRAFRWLASWDGPDVTPFAAGLLLDLPAEDAVAVLRRLARAELLLKSGERLWRPHDLVRVFATAVHKRDVPWAETYLTTRRLIAGYLEAIERPGTAQEWLPAEAENVAVAARTALVAGTVIVSDPPKDGADARGEDQMAQWVGLRDGAELQQDAVGLAEEGYRLAELGSRELGRAGLPMAAAQCVALVYVWRLQGPDRYVELIERDVVNPIAIEALSVMIEQYRYQDDRPMSVGRLHLQLGIELLRQGDRDRAATALNTALSTARELGDRRGEALAMGRLGELAARDGDPDRVRRQLTAAVAVYDDLDEAYVDPVTGKPIDPAEVEEVRERLRALDAEAPS